MKKLISVVTPVYNEMKNLPDVYARVTAVMQTLPQYEYELVFFDDGSTDGSRAVIEAMCAHDPHVKAVFYTRNFGYSKGIFYAVQQGKGDCVILLHADLQNPPELIPHFVRAWENGAQIVQGVKNKSRENPVMFFLRTVYYWLMNTVFGVRLVKHATDFELLDVSFVRILRQVRGNHPFLRGLILEYGARVEYVNYTQEKRQKEATKFNLSKYYDFAMNGIISASGCLPRRMIAVSGVGLLLLLIETIFFFALHAGELPAAAAMNALILRCIGAAVLCGLICLAVLFEYVIGIAKNAEEKPLIIEEKRINY